MPPQNWVDFKEVKASVSIVSVMQRYNVSLRKVNHTAYRGDCPLPQHGQGSKGSFSVSSEKNAWSCQSRSCAETRGKKGGNVLDFVSAMEGCSVRDAAVKLFDWFLVTGGSPSSVALPLASPVPNAPLAFELQGIQHEHRYLLGRGFEEEECEYLGVGFFPGKGSMCGRVVFPIHNERGELVAYCGRAIDGSEPRWKQPAGFQKNLVVYNLHRVEEDTAIVCESFWGVLGCVRAGIMNAVSVMGHFTSPEQTKLMSRFRHLTILFDGDEYGEEGIAQAVTVFPAAEVVRLPKGKQPDHLAPDYLRSLLGQPEDFGEYELVKEAMTA
jgi:DNA primase